MPEIYLETYVAAPIEICFDLCLNVNAHEAAGHGRAVAGVTKGQMQIGDTVTWEAVHSASANASHQRSWPTNIHTCSLMKCKAGRLRAGDTLTVS